MVACCTWFAVEGTLRYASRINDSYPDCKNIQPGEGDTVQVRN